MKKTANRTLPIYIPIAFAVCVAFLIANAFSLYQNLQSLKSANQEMMQTSKIIDHLQYVNVLIVDAESSSRGYYLSGNKIYLGPWKTAQEKIKTEFTVLKDLYKDSPQKMQSLEQLSVLFGQRLAILQETITAYETAGIDAAINKLKEDNAREAQDEIRLQTVIMIGEEKALQSSRDSAFYNEHSDAVILGMLINAGAILVLILFFRLNLRNFNNRLAVQDALELANNSLETTVAQRTEQLSVLSQHLINISEEEKSRLARELHDELGANLTAISMDVGGVIKKLNQTEPELVARLARARETLFDTIDLKRRIIENLRPSMLDNMGLSAALTNYCENFSHISGIHCELDITEDYEQMDALRTVAFFRIVQESLNNVAKYASASNVTIRLVKQGRSLLLQIIDDGIGISLEALSQTKSHGILGMRERALLLGGSFTIQRGANDRGTSITALIPFE